VQWRFEGKLSPLVDPSPVQFAVHFICKRCPVLPLRARPRIAESVVSFPAALGAGPVASGKGHRLIEEEKFRVPVRGHDLTMASPEFQNARDPPPAFVGANNFAVAIVQHAATVAHHHATGRGLDEVAEGIDTVLEWHPKPSWHKEST
jgi:hypothetical protein